MRNDIQWIKRNGMPESVTDRFAKKSEYFFFMTKNQDYYFDLDGIRDKHKQVSIDRQYRGVSEFNKWIDGADGQTPHNLSKARAHTTKVHKEQSELLGSPRARAHREGYDNDPDKINPLGKNPGNVSFFWDDYKHMTFEEYIKMCADYYNAEDDAWDIPTKPSKENHFASYNTKLIDKPIIAGCPKDGIILDPFCGTATTGCRAIELGRKFIGIEGNPEYVKIANKKIEPFVISQQLF